ncbi:MAG: serine hydrolase domain-containing protein [Chloroherpetonaceae bacterium]|nr:serine hydrolase domain-containing protein [Chloroherpetonaceae bacterium]
MISKYPVITQAFTDTLSTYLQEYPEGAELAIAVVKDSLVEFYGVRVSANELLTIENAENIYEIGSITKLFTSILFLSSVSRGEVGLNDSLQQFFPFPLKAGERAGTPVTLTHLSNHTSGLPRVAGSSIKPMIEFITSFKYNPYRSFTQEALENYLKNEMELDTIPGTTESYSNLGASLLGEALVRRTGKSYEVLLQERIFQPLGMTQSTTKRDAIEGKLVKGINLFGGEATNWDFAVSAPAGAILSSVKDLSRLVQAALGLTPTALIEILDQSRRETFRVNESSGVGYGWQIAYRKSGEPIYWHNGATGGYTSALAINPGRNSGVVVLSNVNPFTAENLTTLCFKLLRVIESRSESESNLL